MIASDLPPANMANLLSARLQDWDQARKPQELKLLECYQDVMRIPRAEDTKGTGTARAKKAAGLFMGSTRNKVRSARAKINDALFGNGNLPFDTMPANESLKKFSDTVELIIGEQLERMKFRKMLKSGTNVLAKYGTGFIFGPFVRKECLTEVSVDNSAGFARLTETKYEYDFPYFELGNTLDVYPDPEAREISRGLGTFWVTMESRHTVAAWQYDQSYSNIQQALQGGGDRGNETGSGQAAEMRANLDYWHKNDRIKVARFFGKVPAKLMPKDADQATERYAPGATDPDDAGRNLTNDMVAPSPSTEANLMDAEDDGRMVDVICIMAGGVVVKVSPMPWDDGCGTLRATYEDEEEEIWGVGVAENNIPHQKIINAAVRLFMEGKGMALLGTKSVDRSKFLPTEDFKKFPGKVYQFKPGLSPDDKKNALIDHIEPDITNGWKDVIAVSEQFSDDDTGITKYTQGDDSSNLNKTASGISMIMSASSLPIKEVIQNIDESWIEPIVEALIKWNLKYLDVETVEKIHGKKSGAIWKEIKDFGKTSFMEWKATGTSSFMQKEILTNKVRAFASFVLSNEDATKVVDVRELVEQVWDCMEIGKESPVLKDEDGEKISPQVKQQMDQMQAQNKQLEGALQNAAAEVDKLESKQETDRAKIASQGEVDRYNAETDRLKIILPYLAPQAIQAIADSVGRDALDSPDIDPGRPVQIMPPPDPNPALLPAPMLPPQPGGPAPIDAGQVPSDPAPMPDVPPQDAPVPEEAPA